MKKLLMLFIVLFLLVGCEEKKNNNVAEVKKITCDEAKELASRPNYYLIDVRTREEYDSYHIKDAINIPLDSIKNIVNDSNITLDSIIMVYCKSGNRSKQSADILVGLGYKNVYDLGSITNCN